jgi:hypothetical protein
MSDTYPHYARWLELLGQRNAGIVFVFLVVVGVLALLTEARWLYSRFLPAVRFISVAAYIVLVLFSVMGALYVSIR